MCGVPVLTLCGNGDVGDVGGAADVVGCDVGDVGDVGDGGGLDTVLGQITLSGVAGSGSSVKRGTSSASVTVLQSSSGGRSCLGSCGMFRGSAYLSKKESNTSVNIRKYRNLIFWAISLDCPYWYHGQGSEGFRLQSNISKMFSGGWGVVFLSRVAEPHQPWRGRGVNMKLHRPGVLSTLRKYRKARPAHFHVHTALVTAPFSGMVGAARTLFVRGRQIGL